MGHEHNIIFKQDLHKIDFKQAFEIPFINLTEPKETPER
jgi:hypothetical protein